MSSVDAYPKETTKVHKHFDIEKSETVITHFACAHKGRILKQGRLYITQNYICFYAQIVGKVHKKTIKLADVADVAKTNYGVFPNAIKVTTRKKKEVVFASFLMRDQAYDAIRKEWLNMKGDADIEKEEEVVKIGASTAPRRGSVEPSSGSESEKEKKTKKKRWSLSKKDKKRGSVDSTDSVSDTEIGNDGSAHDASRRHSTSSALTSDPKRSGKHSRKHSEPVLPTPSTPAATSAPPTSSSRPSSTSLSPPSTTRPASTSLSSSPNSSSAPSTPTQSRGDRAEALIKSGAITVAPEPTPTPQANRQSQTIVADAADPTDPSAPAPTQKMWQRMCFFCF